MVVDGDAPSADFISSQWVTVKRGSPTRRNFAQTASRGRGEEKFAAYKAIPRAAIARRYALSPKL
jgi:hypothetical protein